MRIIIIVKASDIPIMDILAFRCVTCIPRAWEAVVHDIPSLRLLIREHEVSSSLKEVFCYVMHIVGIYITATFILTNIDEVHLYDTVDRTIVSLVDDVIVSLLQCLNILNLQRISRCDADHVLCRTVVAFLELLLIALVA